MSSTPQWCTVESDPGVFTELIRRFGVKGVQVEELYDLEDFTFEQLSPIYGLIFLFKWEDMNEPAPTIDDTPGLFFANQVISNACATQALLSILLNCPTIDIGQELTNFRNFTIDLPSDMRGLSMANSECIRLAHNSFARPDIFVLDEKSKSSDTQEAFHFISYVPFEGKLYELDGLQRGAVCLGEVTQSTWLTRVRPAIQSRIQKYSSNEIRFNLMALIRNRQEVYEERTLQTTKRMKVAEMYLSSVSDGTNTVPLSKAFIEASLPTSVPELSVAVAAMTDEIEQLQCKIEDEKNKFARYKIENDRRQHNYAPFIFSLLRQLADKGELISLATKAKAKRKARWQAHQAKEAKKHESDAPHTHHSA